ncbi:hypothetical protein ALMP_72320 [Streptomyces sp. A012304]|nr:hypothetical protein ALMP_72320 [Streptomyces sp. A012304]
MAGHGDVIGGPGAGAHDDQLALVSAQKKCGGVIGHIDRRRSTRRSDIDPGNPPQKGRRHDERTHAAHDSAETSYHEV